MKRNYYIETVRSQYEHAHYKKDLDEVEKIISEKYPGYSDAFTRVMNRRRLHILNMFVMRKSLFDEYCTWLLIFFLNWRRGRICPAMIPMRLGFSASCLNAFLMCG